MSFDKSNSPRFIKSQPELPWWMIRLQKDFDWLGIAPRRVVGFTKSGERIVEICNPEKADFWTVYGHYRPEVTANGEEYFQDFSTATAAQEFYYKLLAKYPHLESQPPSKPQQLKFSFSLNQLK